MSLRERLIRFRLDGLALEVCRPAGAELEQLAHVGPLRSTFVARLVGDGWAYANALRVLGDVVAAAEARHQHQESVEARPTAPASKSEVRGNASPRASRSPAPSPQPTPLRGGGASTGDRVGRPRLLGPVRAPELVAPPQPLAPRPAPAMALGRGPRFDCVHEAECLGRALAAARAINPRDVPQAVHCPPRCAHLQAPSREQRLAEASAGKAPGYSA